MTHILSTLRNLMSFENNRNVDRARQRSHRQASSCRLGLTEMELEPREVPSLSPVSPSAGYPFTAIVEIRATFPDHTVHVGSGVMVDRFHVLTAGHVLYESGFGGFASSVTVVPKLNGYSEPYGEAQMTYERTFSTFINYDRAHPGQTAPGDYDVGLITLNRNIGDSTGWMSYGYDNNNTDFARGATYNTAGYPAAGGYDGRHMEFSAGTIDGLSPDGNAINYYQSHITTFGGQSGSPVWRYNTSTNARTVYGIHVAGSGKASSLNFATRITQSIFNTLQSWRNADVPPRIATTVSPSPEVVSTSQADEPAISVPSPLGIAPGSESQREQTLSANGDNKRRIGVVEKAFSSTRLAQNPVYSLAASVAPDRPQQAIADCPTLTANEALHL